MRDRARDTPFVRAYFVMLDGLGIASVPDPGPEAAAGGDDSRVRVDVSTA